MLIEILKFCVNLNMKNNENLFKRAFCNNLCQLAGRAI